MRQSELAALVGYEQSYLSALEAGVKGPPTDEFVARLSRSLGLSKDQDQKLYEAFEASKRRYVLPVDCSEEVFYLFQELRGCLADLPAAEARLITDALKLLRERACPPLPSQQQRPSARKMEAPM